MPTLSTADDELLDAGADIATARGKHESGTQGMNPISVRHLTSPCRYLLHSSRDEVTHEKKNRARISLAWLFAFLGDESVWDMMTCSGAAQPHDDNAELLHAYQEKTEKGRKGFRMGHDAVLVRFASVAEVKIIRCLGARASATMLTRRCPPRPYTGLQG